MTETAARLMTFSRCLPARSDHRGIERGWKGIYCIMKLKTDETVFRSGGFLHAHSLIVIVLL
jgi:hypothetical protein